MTRRACAATAATWGGGQETCAIPVRMDIRRQVCAHCSALWGLMGLFVPVWRSAFTESVAYARMGPVDRYVSTTSQHVRQLSALPGSGAHHVKTNAQVGPVMFAAAMACAGVGGLVMECVSVMLALLQLIAASSACHHQIYHAGATVPATVF